MEQWLDIKKQLRKEADINLLSPEAAAHRHGARGPVKNLEAVITKAALGH